ALDKAPHLIRIAEQIAPALPLGDDFSWPQHILGEASARFALAFLSVSPLHFHRFGILGETKVKGELAAAALAQDHGVHQRTGDSTALVWEWNSDARRFPYGLSLAQDDIEHSAVDRAIG